MPLMVAWCKPLIRLVGVKKRSESSDKAITNGKNENTNPKRWKKVRRSKRRNCAEAWARLMDTRRFCALKDDSGDQNNVGVGGEFPRAHHCPRLSAQTFQLGMADLFKRHAVKQFRHLRSHLRTDLGGLAGKEGFLNLHFLQYRANCIQKGGQVFGQA